MKRYTCIALVLLLILSMTACSREPENLMEAVKPNISYAQNATGYEPEILDFYMNLFRKTHAQDKNTLISPLSVLQALSMTANGARGETLRQMEEVFGLDIDALRIVAEGVNKLKTPETSTIVITHYQRLLDYIKPDIVHVLYNGRIVKTAGPELALELEERGYDWIKNENP